MHESGFFVGWGTLALINAGLAQGFYACSGVAGELKDFSSVNDESIVIENKAPPPVPPTKPRPQPAHQGYESPEAELQIHELQDRRDQDRRVLSAQKINAESDANAATIIWIGSSMALAVVILLLVRERRIRLLLERLSRLVPEKQERGP